MDNINWLSAIPASLFGLVFGSIWYTPLFGKTWPKLVNSNPVKGPNPMKDFPLRVAGSYICTLIMALTLAAFIGADADWTYGLFAGFAAGAGWVAMAFGSNYIFANRPVKAYLIDAGYYIILLSVMGLIIGLF